MSTGEAEGRNLLRIKINRPPTAAGAAAGAEVGGGKQGEAGGGKDGDSSCPLEFLAGLADDVATPQAGHLQQQQQQGPAASAAPPADPVVLLSKQLLRVRAPWSVCLLLALACLRGWRGRRFCLSWLICMPTAFR